MFWPLTNHVLSMCSLFTESLFSLSKSPVHVRKKSVRGGGGFPALLGVYTLVYSFPLVLSEECNSYPINGS